MKKISQVLTLLLLLIIMMNNIAWAQQKKNFRYEYNTILLDSTYTNQDPKMKKKIDGLEKKMSKEMDIVIGYCPRTLSSFFPSSPLSNLLTDMLYDFSNDYNMQSNGLPVDFSILNFGGIRNIIPEGDVTIETIYKVLPFDNSLAIVTMKGEEITKMLHRFNDKKNQPYSKNLYIYYSNGKPFKILINGEKIVNDRLYRIATVDFIAKGGDGIMKDIVIEEVNYTKELLRDIVIKSIKKLTDEGKQVIGTPDHRAEFQIQY